MQISIIIPIYEVEAYLEECLQSVLNQSYKDLDIVLVDDGSFDKSLEIATRYAKMDSRIFLISKPNGGLSSARNLGLECIKGTGLRNLLEELEETQNPKKKKQGGGGQPALATLDSLKRNSLNQNKTPIPFETIKKHFTKIDSRIYKCDLAFINDLITQELPKNAWIHLLDSDDYLKLDCIENALKASKDDTELITHKIIRYNETNGEFSDCPYINPKKNYYKTGLDFLIDHDFYACYFAWQGVFKASILNRYGLRFTDKIFHEDHDFGTLLFVLSKGVLHEDFEGLVYRQRQGSIMSSYGQTAFPSRLPSDLESLRPHFDDYQELRRYYKTYCLCVIAHQLHNFTIQDKSLSRRAKKLFLDAKRYYIHDYIYTYSHLNYLDPQGRLRDLGITDLEKYKRQDRRRQYFVSKYQKLRNYWRHPRKLVKRILGYS